MVTVGLGLTIIGLVAFAVVVALGMWAIRHDDRMFPKGFDRTGWSPNRERVGWLMTKFTWLSGGRS